MEHELFLRLALKLRMPWIWTVGDEIPQRVSGSGHRDEECNPDRLLIHLIHFIEDESDTGTDLRLLSPREPLM